jgi:hypothetical protein
MEQGLRSVIQDIPIGKILIQTDAATCEPLLHYCKLVYSSNPAARHFQTVCARYRCADCNWCCCNDGNTDNLGPPCPARTHYFHVSYSDKRRTEHGYERVPQSQDYMLGY